jgi:hypothetical protein
MQLLAQPHPDCPVHDAGDYVRANVGSGSPHEIQECYRTLATVVLQHKRNRVLIVGLGGQDAHTHLAARDIVIALDVIGVPTGFKIAFVPKSDVTLNGFKHAETEAARRAVRAKVFHDEASALRWLLEPDLH